MRWQIGHYQRLDLAKKRIQKYYSNFVLIVEAKPVKSLIAENITSFEIKLIRRLIYGNEFHNV